MQNKRGMEAWIIVAIVLALILFVIFIVGYITLQSKGVSALDFIRDLFRFGGSNG